jgi:hypothetical protein
MVVYPLGLTTTVALSYFRSTFKLDATLFLIE